MNKIRENRRRLGLTQVELANQLNLSQGALSGYETGRYDPDMETMRRLAEYFHVSLDDLFGDAAIEQSEIGDIDFALSGEIRDLTDAEKQDVLDYVRFKRAQKARQEAK